MTKTKTTKKTGKKKNKGTDGKHKVAKKNILLSPFQNDWPKVDKETEHEILDDLIMVLSGFPKLCPEKERGGSSSKKHNLHGEDDMIRRKLRLQLALGHRQVCKGLERDDLALLLVWAGQASILLRSLLPLAATRRCPGLCLQELMPRVSEAFGLSSLLAVGFRKCQPELRDFESFISKAVAAAPPLNLPWLNCDTTSTHKASIHTFEKMEESEEESPGKSAQNSQAKEKEAEKVERKIGWPLLADDSERNILDRLCSLLKPYSEVFRPQNLTSKRKLRDMRTVVRSHLVTEMHIINDAIKSGQLLLLLVQYEPDLPCASSTSTVVAAVKKGFPVLHLKSLRLVLAPILRNPLLKLVGLKRPRDEKAASPTEFTDFVGFTKQLVPPDLAQHLPADNIKEQRSSKDDAGHERKDINSSGKKLTKKTPIPKYDVSHLYVYKAAPCQGTPSAESPEAVQEKKKRFKLSGGTVESFILLSSKPTVKIVMPKLDFFKTNAAEASQKEAARTGKTQALGLESSWERFKAEAGDPPAKCWDGDESTARGAPGESVGGNEAGGTFVVDSSAAISKPAKFSKTTGRRAESSTTLGSDSPVLFGIMGMDSGEDSEQLPLFHEARKTKNRARRKRKLDSKVERGDVSFKLVPANVQTCTANPNKRKRNKKK